MISAFDKIDRKLIDAPIPRELLHEDESGYPANMSAGDTIDVIREACGDAARDFPQALWIEPKDWKDRARDNDKYKTWGLNRVDRFTNQSPTHECTCHSLSRGCEAAWNRQRGNIFADGPKKGYRYEQSKKGSVWLSPLSVYSEANPGQWGGAGIRQVMEIACRRGFLPEKIQPAEYKFKHSLQGTTGQGGLNQSTGPWVRMSNFPEGWQETAKHFRPREVIFPGSWEQAICLLLHGLLVCVGRSGHAVPWAMYNVEEQVAPYPDSYDVIRYDSLSTIKYAWSGAFAIATMTTPDSWLEPSETLAV